MAALFDAIDLLQRELVDPRFLHHPLGALLALAPLLGAILLLGAAFFAREGTRPALVLLGALLPLLLAYDAVLTLATKPPNEANGNSWAELLDPSRAAYRRDLAQHQREVRLLYIPSLILIGLAIWGILRGKPRPIHLILSLSFALLTSALALLILQRKIRLDHPELPPGSESLEEVFRSTHGSS